MYDNGVKCKVVDRDIRRREFVKYDRLYHLNVHTFTLTARYFILFQTNGGTRDKSSFTAQIV